MKLYIYIFIIYLLYNNVFAQENKIPIAINEGIYLTFKEFKQNNPYFTDFEVSKEGVNDILYITCIRLYRQ